MNWYTGWELGVKNMNTVIPAFKFGQPMGWRSEKNGSERVQRIRFEFADVSMAQLHWTTYDWIKTLIQICRFKHWHQDECKHPVHKSQNVAAAIWWQWLWQHVLPHILFVKFFVEISLKISLKGNYCTKFQRNFNEILTNFFCGKRVWQWRLPHPKFR